MDGTFVVFGASGAVGSAVARRLAVAGRSVIVAGRNPQRIQAVACECDCKWLECDVTVPGAIAACLDAACETHGDISGIANCVGSLKLAPAHATKDHDFAEIIEVNLTSAFRTVRAAASAMRPHGGSIVLVSSAAARIGMPNHEAIAAAKAGVEGLMRSAAATYAGRGIRVNAVSPGLTKSEMTRRLWESAAAETISTQMHALGRLGEPDEVASAITWLLTDESSWVTGQVIGVDGGLSQVISRAKVRR